MGNFEKVSAIYEGMFNVCGSDATAASILTLATIIEGVSESFFDRASHDLCLGIRYGIFGIDARANDSIKDLVDMLIEDD